MKNTLKYKQPKEKVLILFFSNYWSISLFFKNFQFIFFLPQALEHDSGFIGLLQWDEENFMTEEFGKCFTGQAVNIIGTTFIF